MRTRSSHQGGQNRFRGSSKWLGSELVVTISEADFVVTNRAGASDVRETRNLFRIKAIVKNGCCLSRRAPHRVVVMSGGQTGSGRPRWSAHGLPTKRGHSRPKEPS